ncbi:MAG: hypothetical protein QXI77_01180 [Nanopusillaceae archaeon]
MIQNRLFIVFLLTLIVINIITIYLSIFILYSRYLFLKIGHDTTVHLQKVINTMNLRPFVSSEMFGCASHHWDLTLILFFGPLLKIFNNPLPVIFSPILGYLTSIIIFLLFYFIDRKYVLIAFLCSLAYLFNEYIILRGLGADYADSILFTIFFSFSILLFTKKRYDLALIPMFLSYNVNLETIPYQSLLFFSTILFFFNKKMDNIEKRAFIKYTIFTMIYILLFHFLLYRWLSRDYDNVFEFYYKNRHRMETEKEENPIFVLIKNIANLNNEKLDFLTRHIIYLFPFSLIPANLFNVLMSLSASERFYGNYTSPDTHYHITIPIFTVLTIFFYFYYNKPSSKKILILFYIILIATLVIKLNYVFPLIIRSYNYVINLSQNVEIIEKKKELLDISSKYIDFKKSIMAPLTVSYLFYNTALVLPITDSTFNSKECKILSNKFRCLDKDPIKTYYLLFDRTEIKNCDEHILTKNLEEDGYRKIYSGKYFILFEIENESEAYYGMPLI